jgi:hypothetical protein
MSVRPFLSLGLVMLVVIGWLAWMTTEQKYTAFEILAHRVPNLAQPVYAQFTYTQTLQIQDAIRVPTFILPMYVPEAGRKLNITLYRNGKVIAVWPYQTLSIGVTNVRLELLPPHLLDGNVELTIKGHTITVDDWENAPRLFIETDGTAYPDGHYRIADNEKQGDIALTVLEQKSKWEVLKEKWSEQPLEVVSRMLLLGFVLWCVAMIPISIFGRESPAV